MARFLITLLGSSKQNCDWHIFTVSILFVRKSFIKILFITNSRDFKSVFVSGQASREYSKIGRHLLLTIIFLLCAHGHEHCLSDN